MAGTDKVDTHGHTKDQAVAEYPTLDVNATPGSAVFGTPRTYANFGAFDNTMVLAQSTAEVNAQIANDPG